MLRITLQSQPPPTRLRIRHKQYAILPTPTFKTQPLKLVVKTQFEKKNEKRHLRNSMCNLPNPHLVSTKKILPIFSGPLRSPCRVPKRFWALAVAKGWIPTNEASNLRGEKCDDDDSNNNNNNRNRDAGFKGN